MASGFDAVFFCNFFQLGKVVVIFCQLSAGPARILCLLFAKIPIKFDALPIQSVGVESKKSKK